MLLSVLMLSPPSPATERFLPTAQGVPCLAGVLPPNIQVTEALAPTVADLLLKSPSFERQCHRLGREAAAVIRVRMTPAMPRDYFAFSEIRRSGGKILGIDVVIATRADHALALAHEFEHILEQLEGWDLPALAQQSGTGVRQLYNGSYETRRAISAGHQARREMAAFDTGAARRTE